MNGPTTVLRWAVGEWRIDVEESGLVTLYGIGKLDSGLARQFAGALLEAVATSEKAEQSHGA